MRLLSVFLGLALMLGTPVLAEAKVYKIKSTANWAILDAEGINAPVSMDGGKEGIRFQYERGRPTQFRFTLPLKEFAQLEVEIRSEQAITLDLLVLDEGGGKYRYSTPLEAGDWAHLTVKPQDLIPEAQENLLSPDQVSNEFRLTEPLGAIEVSGRNTLTIRKVRVETPDKN